MPAVSRRDLIKLPVLGVGGYFAAPAHARDAASIASQQTPEWQRTFGGDGDDAFSDVTQTRDGGYLAVGQRHPPDSGAGQGWYLKTDDEGREEWSDTFSPDGSASTHLTAVVPTDDGRYRLFGGLGAGDQPVFGGLTVDASGSVQATWQSSIGGEALAATSAGDGTSVVAGEASTSNEPGSEGLVVKVDDGDIGWEHRVSPATEDGNARLNAVIRGSDGGYVAAGMTTRSGRGAPLILKLDERGSREWVLEAIGDEELEDRFEFFGLSRTVDGGYLAVGELVEVGEDQPNGHVNKIGPDGEHQWSVNTTDGADLDVSAADGFRDGIAYEGGFMAVGYHDDRGGWAVELGVNEIRAEKGYGAGEFSAMIGTDSGQALLAGAKETADGTDGWLALSSLESALSTVTPGQGDATASPAGVGDTSTPVGGAESSLGANQRGFFSNSGDEPAFLTNVFNLTVLGFLLSIAGIFYQMMEGK